MSRKAVRGMLFLLPVLILLLNLNGFPFSPGSQFSDLAISHYPNAAYLKRVITTWGTIPLWSSTILSGYPFAANPLSGLFYPPGWLALLFPLTTGFNLVIALHLIWGGVGLYLLLRAEKLAEGPALLGGLAFEALPKLFAHLGAGHLSLLYAVPWTPWLLLAERESSRWMLSNPRKLRGGWRGLLPGAVLAVILLADVRWAFYAGLLWLAYALRESWAQCGGQPWQRIRMVSLRVVINGLFVFLATAPLLLPVMEYIQLATRERLSPGESFIYSLEWGQLLGLIYPYLRGPAEWMLYPGGVIASLGVAALILPPLRRRACFWWSVVGVSLFFSMGSSIPYLDVLAWLPGFNLLRVPPRALFITGMGLSCVAAYAFHYLTTCRMESLPEQMGGKKTRFHPLFGLVIITLFVALLGVTVAVTIPQAALKLQFAWGSGAFVLGTVVILFASRSVREDQSPVKGLTAVLITLMLLDLLAVNAVGLEFRSPDAVLGENAGVAAYLRNQNHLEYYRVYSPSYSLPQQTAEAYQIELADGVDPLQISSYASFMELASGVPFEGYSVTLPPFASGDPAVDNQGYQPDCERLGLLNVQYVLAEYDLPGSGLILLKQMGNTRIYENPYVMPRAWVQRVDAPLGEGVLSTPGVEIMPNKIRVEAEGPGLLVLSEVQYPGWTVSVDGQPAEIQSAGGLLRSVRLTEGRHQAVFAFQPTLLYIGLALAVLSWGSLLVLYLTGRK